MGAIQNSVNQGVGTIAGAVAMGTHIKQQKESVAKQEEANKLTEKGLEVKKLEAEQELDTAKRADDVGTNEAIKDAKFNDKKTWDEATRNIAKQTEGPEIDANKVLDEYNAIKETQAKKELSLSHVGFDMASMSQNKRKINAASVRLAKAEMAYREVQDAIEAQRKLKFDVNIATKKLEALGGNK